MPYSVETLDEMDDRLDLIVTRLSEAIEGKDWDVAFLWWHRELARWIAMKVSSSPS
jgi:proteasome activator subunit 4